MAGGYIGGGFNLFRAGHVQVCVIHSILHPELVRAAAIHPLESSCARQALEKTFELDNLACEVVRPATILFICLADSAPRCLTLRLPASLCTSVDIRLRWIVYCQDMKLHAYCIQLLLSSCSISSKHTSQYVSVSHTDPRLRLRIMCVDAAVHAKKGLNWAIMALLERVLNVVACTHVDDVTGLAAPRQCLLHSGFGK